MISTDAMWRAGQAASDCDLMLVIGTSAIVQPACMMPVYAKQSGAKVVEINPDRTPLTGAISDYLIQGEAGDIMNRILAQMNKMGG
jgi:NAD-dependent deacetylase